MTEGQGETSRPPAMSPSTDILPRPTDILPPSALPTPPAPPTPVAAASDPPPSLTAQIPLASTRRLLAESFDLLTRSSREMRRASFYIGLIVLGTAGPFAVATLAREAVGFDMDFEGYLALTGATDGLLGLLGLLAFVGIAVAAVEARSMAMGLLGSRMAAHPISIRGALARSRQTFWRAIVASIVVAIPVALVQSAVSLVVDPLFGLAAEASLITSTLVSAVVGAPFAYVLAGVVLGDVDPFEAVRRSFRVYRVRRPAASIVAVFETITALLLVLGLGAGLDVVFRLFGALGLGIESDAVGLAVTVVGVAAIVFAFGTLLFTVMAITIAPQVVMFVGLTHTTVGLDRVRASAPDDPAVRRLGSPRFLWLSRLMLVGFAVGAIGLGLVVQAAIG